MGCVDVSGVVGRSKLSRIVVVGGFAESLRLFRGDLLLALHKAGHETHAVAPGLMQDIPTRRFLEENDIVVHDAPIERTGMNLLKDLRALWVLYCLFRRLRPDVVLTYTIKPVIYGTLAAKLAGVPYRCTMLTGLGYTFSNKEGEGPNLLKSMIRLLYGFALKYADRVVFQNPDDRELFIELGLARKEQCGLVQGSGIHLGRFTFQAMPSLADGVNFLLIARLLRDKGVYEYIDAARRVRREFPDVRFHLVGWIDSNPEAIHQADLDAWVAEGLVTYHGRLSDVRPVIKASHVYVLPSYREGTPRTVLEAMAMGRPIITTDVPGCRETVVDGETGYLVPVKDSAALADAMKRFVHSPKTITSMGKKARDYAIEKFDVHTVNAVMMGYMGLK